MVCLPPSLYLWCAIEWCYHSIPYWCGVYLQIYQISVCNSCCTVCYTTIAHSYGHIIDAHSDVNSTIVYSPL